MKKLIIAAAVLSMMLSAAGCGGKSYKLKEKVGHLLCHNHRGELRRERDKRARGGKGAGDRPAPDEQ